ncbi:MAG TPA: TonB family protein [Acidobacteriaceae bacterium]|nr:TonB family protein [Acidobacteriaceae bacterium]
MAGRRISGDMPVYPAIAKTAHIQGTVVLRALISSEGKIEHLRVISGPPMLQAAAVDAVRTWTYEPYLLNGQPVTVRTQINVIFTLAGRPPEPIANQLVASARAPSPNGRNRAVRVVRVNVTPPLQTTDSSPEGSQPPAHPITAEQVHEMMQLTGAVNLTKQMLDGMMPTLRQSMPAYMPPDVLDDFEKTLLGSDFEAMMVRTYQAHLSSEDAAVVIAFYKTPAGQHMLAAMPQIAKDSQAAGEQLGQQVMMEVLQRHQTEIEAAKEKYETQHPWSAPKN